MSVSDAGDVNRDGYADVIVGAPADDEVYPYSGSARVLSGKDGTTLYMFSRQGNSFGRSVSGAGDVNGDGFADVIVGAGNNSSPTKVFSGKDGAILYSFTDSGDNISVSGAGDVNADGFSDMVVGFKGIAQVFSGKDGTLIYNLNYSDPVSSVSDAGDLNKDGYADFLVGTMYFQSTRGINSWAYSGKDGSILFDFGAIEYAGGYSVSGAGDVNADGYNDVVIGNPGDNPYSSGSAKVFSGKDGSLIHVFRGTTGEDRLGFSVSGAGDINGDGFSDVIVGKIDRAAQVFSGRDGSIIFDFTDPVYGRAVSGAGDINGDGFSDIILGSPYYTVDGKTVGAARVFVDQCPTDPNKTKPGQCGCGTPDTDSDNDGTADCNENKPPTDITLSANTILENAAPNTIVGTLSTADPDAGDTFTYSLVAGAGDSDNAAFNISGNSLRATNSFDFETKNIYSIRLKSADREGLSTEKAFTITVNDVEDLISGTAANDSFIATYTGDGAAHRWLVTRGGTTVFNGYTGTSLVIDGLAGRDTLQIVGRAANDTFISAAGQTAVNGAVLLSPQIELIRFTTVAGNDLITLLDSAASTATLSIDGGTGTDRIESAAGNNTWNITGVGAGTLNGSQSFIAVESLVGSPENDQFNFSAAGSVSGQVVGGSGVDTLNLSAKNTTLTVNLQTNTATSTGGISGMDVILAGSATTDTLIGTNTINSWLIDGANSGTLNSQVLFSGFENITGGTGADTFTIAANGSVSRVINGGTGTDQIDVSAKLEPLEFRLGAPSSITGVAGGYSGIERVFGNGTPGSRIIGTNGNTTWALGSSGELSVSSTIYKAVGSIEAGAGADTLMGPALSSTWSITSVNSGTIDFGISQIAFSGVENLVGGMLADQFIFGSEGWIAGVLNAGTGIDVIDFSSSPVPVNVDLQGTPKVAGISFSGAEKVRGNGRCVDLSSRYITEGWIWLPSSGSSYRINEAGDVVIGTVSYQGFGAVEGQGVDTVTGPSAATKWLIASNSLGAIANVGTSCIYLHHIENILGGSQTDEFVLEGDRSPGYLFFNIDGGLGEDIANMGSIRIPGSQHLAFMSADGPGSFKVGELGTFRSVERIFLSPGCGDNCRF